MLCFLLFNIQMVVKMVMLSQLVFTFQVFVVTVLLLMVVFGIVSRVLGVVMYTRMGVLLGLLMVCIGTCMPTSSMVMYIMCV